MNVRQHVMRMSSRKNRALMRRIARQVERDYCLGCGREIITESGQICPDCAVRSARISGGAP